MSNLKGKKRHVTVNGKINSTKDTDSKPWTQKMNEEMDHIKRVSHPL